MAKDLNRVVQGASVSGDEEVRPINPVFLRRLVTGSVRGSPRMGLEGWWSSPAGVTARSIACSGHAGGSNKCALHNTVRENDRGIPPRCISCDTEYRSAP